MRGEQGQEENGSASVGGRKLDFTVIGAQRAGTTSLWMHMRGHPQLYLPPDKEVSFFSADARYARGLPEYLDEHFALAPSDALLGTVTPHYMAGSESASLDAVVDRMASTAPGIRLIAILRDPIQRAFSEYRLTVHRGLESHGFSKAVHTQLAQPALDKARAMPKKGTTYVAQGEYGRILDRYLQSFSRDQLLVLPTAELQADPARTMERIFGFLGVDCTYVPENLDRIYFRGGTQRRLSAEDEAELSEYLEESVWPRMGDPRVAEDAKRGFEFWLRHWNVIPDERPRWKLKPYIEEELRSHYRSDAELLTSLTGFEPPWISDWDDSPVENGAPGKKAEDGHEAPVRQLS